MSEADVVADMNTAAVVDSHSPGGSAGVEGGETVGIYGSGFIGATSVSIGFSSPWFQVVSDTEIHCTAPAFDPNQTSDPASAKVVVWKNSLSNDSSSLAEWTWGGSTRQQLQDAQANA